MPKSKSLPDHVLTVTSFEELRQFATAFAYGHLNLLFVLGAAGTGKTRAVQDAVGRDCCWVHGSASAFGLYVAAYQHRDEAIVLDDVDGLYKDRAGLRLLKCLCQTEPEKKVSWLTNCTTLDLLGIPKEFTTTSRMVVIANQWKSLNADVAALEDRGHLIHFSPSAVELHRQAGTWFWDQEVFDFAGEHLHLTQQHSLRVYPLAWEMKTAGMNWRAMVLSRCLSGAALEVAKLRTDKSFESEDARVRAFVEAGLGCRATYFNHARRLATAQAVPKIQLTHTAPPQPPCAVLSFTDFYLQQNGELGSA